MAKSASSAPHPTYRLKITGFIGSSIWSCMIYPVVLGGRRARPEQKEQNEEKTLTRVEPLKAGADGQDLSRSGK